MLRKLGIGCLSIIGIVVALGIIGATMGGGSRKSTAALIATSAPAGAAPESSAPPPVQATEPTAAPAVAGPQVYQVGDVAQLGDVALTVLGWSRPEGTQFAQPEAGKSFIGVELLIVNQGDDDANLSTLAQMSLKDGEDRRYTVDLIAATALNGAAPEGELVPGERVRGSVGFQVPADAAGLTFVFDGGLFFSGKVFVGLGAEPVLVEPPAALAGEAASVSFPIGEPIAVGDLSITINGVSSPEGLQFAQPAPGSRFIAVDLSVTNSGDVAVNVSTMLQMKLKDSTGQQYSINLLAATAAGGAAPEGELSPGETVRGPVGFQVPADVSGLLFVFDGNIFGAGKVFVQLP